jgi:hypothetical protein
VIWRRLHGISGVPCPGSAEALAPAADRQRPAGPLGELELEREVIRAVLAGDLTYRDCTVLYAELMHAGL